MPDEDGAPGNRTDMMLLGLASKSERMLGRFEGIQVEGSRRTAKLTPNCAEMGAHMGRVID